MNDTPTSDRQEKLAHWLHLRFVPAGTTDAPDENDVAAYVAGRLPVMRRIAMESAMERDPSLQHAVAFEQESRQAERRRSWSRQAVACAGVVAVLSLAAHFAFMDTPWQVQLASAVREHDAATVSALVDAHGATSAPSPEDAELLALARFSRGEVVTGYAWAGPSTVRDHVVLRSDEAQPAILAPRGRMSCDARVLRVDHMPPHATLVVYATAKPELELARLAVSDDSGKASSVTLPGFGDAQSLSADLMDRDGRVVASTSWSVIAASGQRVRDAVHVATSRLGTAHDRALVEANLLLASGFAAECHALLDSPMVNGADERLQRTRTAALRELGFD